MKFSKFLFSSSLILLLSFALLTIAQPDFLDQSCFNDRGNYTTNSIYKNNLDTLLSSLNSGTETRGGRFYSLSTGQAPDRVELKALCRGDIGEEDCKGCIRNSTSKVLEICPNQKDAYGAYDLCNIRYSSRSTFGVQETEPSLSLVNSVNASNVDEFIRAQQTLSSRLRGLAAAGDSTQKFAVGSEGAGFETVYGLMQCSPDLSGQQCDDCLGQAIGDIAGCCAGRKGGRVIKPSCQVRFEDLLFYQLTPSVTPLPPGTSPPPPPNGEKDSNTAKIVVIVVVPTVCVVILAIFIYLFLRRRKIKARTKAGGVGDIETAESLQLDFDIISVPTNSFSDENKLGQGGFGAVYKGSAKWTRYSSEKAFKGFRTRRFGI